MVFARLSINCPAWPSNPGMPLNPPVGMLLRRLLKASNLSAPAPGGGLPLNDARRAGTGMLVEWLPGLD